MDQAQPPIVRLPLPGGSPAASVAVTGLLTATMAGPRAWFFREPGPSAGLHALGLTTGRGGVHRFPVGAFLIEHPTGGAILVDAGLAREATHDPMRAVGRVGATVFGDLRMRSDQAVAARLAEREVELQAVVMTHLHWDHASGLVDLPGARVFVTVAEWRAAHRRLASLNGYLRRHLDAPVRFELLDLLAAQAWGPFKRSLDLFDDGSVVLVETAGHSPGHLSVVLRLRDRMLLIAGDALYTMRTLREDVHPWMLGSARRYRRSIAAIRAFARNGSSAVLPGHDLDAWEASGVEGTL